MPYGGAVPIETGVLVLALVGGAAYVVRGITGGASAVVFNALFGLAIAFGLTGGLTLLDGLYWVSLGDLVAGFLLLWILRRQIRLEPFLVRFLIVSVPLNVAFTLLAPHLDVTHLTLGLGIAIALAGTYLTAQREIHTWDEPTLVRRALPGGILAGALGGLYGMAGPVTVIYLAHAGSDPGRYRARLTTLSVFWSSFRIATLVLAGQLTLPAVARFGVTLPAILVGLAIGVRLHPHVGPDRFRRLLGITVMVAGVLLVVRTLTAGG